MGIAAVWFFGATLAAFAQVSPCTSSAGQLPSATVTAGTPIYYGTTDLSAGGGQNFNVNTNGQGSPTGNASVTFQSPGKVCLGPGFQASAGSGGGFHALVAVAMPWFSPAGGNYTTGQSVTITTAASNATIRYTTDGTAPSRTLGTVYAGPVPIGATTTLKAIAYISGLNDSPVTTAVYTISAAAGAPTVSPPAGTYMAPTSVTLSSSTPGASIRYTVDDTTPTATVGTLYGGAFTLSSAATVKAIAYATGWLNSPVSSAAFSFAAAAPAFQPPTGTYAPGQTVTLSTTTPGASIRFTTDGSTPTETTGTLYSAPISVTNGMMIRAIAYLPGWVDSSVTGETYTIQGGSGITTREYIRLNGRLLAVENNIGQTVVTPVFSPSGGVYATAQSVTITTTTTGATIRYTTDGSTPSETSGTLYTAPVYVGTSMTLMAIAYESAWTDSSVASATYAITGTVAVPTFSLAGGTYTTPQSVSITTATSGATIRYTTDGSAPSETNGILYTGPVSLSANTTLKAIAFEAGWIDSAVGSAVYTITDPVPTALEFIPNCYPCSSGAAGTAQQFTIQVGDNFGALAIRYVQPLFSSTSDLSSTSNSCHLEYAASNNTLYLDSSAGNFSWVGSQPQGGGWTGSNSNGVCQVNSWSTSLSGNYLTLYVSVIFQAPSTWYYYLSATNATGTSPWATNGLSWTAH